MNHCTVVIACGLSAPARIYYPIGRGASSQQQQQHRIKLQPQQQQQYTGNLQQQQQQQYTGNLQQQQQSCKLQPQQQQQQHRYGCASPERLHAALGIMQLSHQQREAIAAGWEIFQDLLEGPRQQQKELWKSLSQLLAQQDQGEVEQQQQQQQQGWGQQQQQQEGLGQQQQGSGQQQQLQEQQQVVLNPGHLYTMGHSHWQQQQGQEQQQQQYQQQMFAAAAGAVIATFAHAACLALRGGDVSCRTPFGLGQQYALLLLLIQRLPKRLWHCVLGLLLCIMTDLIWLQSYWQYTWVACVVGHNPA